MSKIALSGNASGTGTLTIAAPNTSTDRTLTLPDSSGTMATAESTLTQFNASGSAPVYAARAWVNFNGTGTVAIRASGNVTSITDNGLGDYTVNFTTAMSDASYSIAGTASRSGTTGSASAGVTVTPNDVITARTTSSCRILLLVNAGDGGFDGPIDSAQTNIVIFR